MIRYFKSNPNYVEDLKICKTEAEGKSYPCLPNESWKWIEIESDEFKKLERSIMKNEFVFCQRCGAKLKTLEGGEYNVIWLEYDQRTGTYTNKEVPSEFSQGGFPFGKDCAKIALAENEAAEENARLILENLKTSQLVVNTSDLDKSDNNRKTIQMTIKTEAIRFCIQAQHGKEDYAEARKELNALLARIEELEAAQQKRESDAAKPLRRMVVCPECETMFGVELS